MSLLRRLIAAAPLALLLTTLGCANDSEGGVSSVRMAAIRSHGQLICGVDGQVTGFSSVAANGRYQGFDVEV